MNNINTSFVALTGLNQAISATGVLSVAVTGDSFEPVVNNFLVQVEAEK